ncbi:MAG TPA: HNH endonuclease signature motif containing protein, partial [Candidatus Krumholzibacteriaceae bacterium]|nr:HNH endonuclease signature motif containing protein [Candidatus Krumholzibacteriaceae bacterium]
DPAGTAETDTRADNAEVKQKFKLEFMVNPEFLKKVEEIRSELSRKYPAGVSFEILFNIVMDEYLKRHGPERRIKRREKRKSSKKRKPKYVSKDNRKRRKENSGHRTRDIPAAVRDEVYRRDKGRCSFVGRNGRRCGSTWNLQIDHIVPFARGGDNSPCNLRLLCERHNRLEAERAYGKDFMRKYIRKE